MDKDVNENVEIWPMDGYSLREGGCFPRIKNPVSALIRTIKRKWTSLRNEDEPIESSQASGVENVPVERPHNKRRSKATTKPAVRPFMEGVTVVARAHVRFSNRDF
ncbi:uncharacterized protein LOC141901944 isoform X2 [Tubulanus polymorphus]|uniref:uncharacterized protein LOC141901944 isoform X2 n=1 Tax=Tubulanus polymorphus TaxID=672921 RepID=UPI003DA4717D